MSSFFCLPRELRDVVYEKTFETPNGSRIITPDPTYARRRAGGDLSKHTINNGLALLQSCQQAHEEATAVLYGRHIFHFDDHQLGPGPPRRGYQTVYGHLQRLRGESNPGAKSLPNGDEENLWIQGCDRFDYIVMHDWFLVIGKRNRLAIRQLHLGFSHNLFTIHSSRLDRVHHYLRRQQGRMVRCSLTNEGPVQGRDFLTRAFLLIAEAHQLDRIDMSFGNPADLMLVNDKTPQPTNKYDWNIFTGFWCPTPNDYLLPALASIRNIKCLRCADATTNEWRFLTNSDGMSISDMANNSLHRVKATMESGYVPEKERDLPLNMSDSYVDQTKRYLMGWPTSQTSEADNGTTCFGAGTKI